MSSEFPPSIGQRMTAFLRRAKAALSKDYSVQDIKGWFAGKASAAQSASPSLVSQAARPSVQLPKIAFQNIPSAMYDFVLRHRMGVITLGCVLAFALVSVLWLVPLRDQWQATLALRPVQWAQLQHLVKLSKANLATSASSGTLQQSSSSTMTFALLDEAELQKLRAILSARDIKPNVLRLTADNPPRLELQANEVLFSGWLELQDELRQVWRLYPETVSVIATATPGLVQISSTLKQALPASSPAGMTP